MHREPAEWLAQRQETHSIPALLLHPRSERPNTSLAVRWGPAPLPSTQTASCDAPPVPSLVSQGELWSVGPGGPPCGTMRGPFRASRGRRSVPGKGAQLGRPQSGSQGPVPYTPQTHPSGSATAPAMRGRTWVGLAMTSAVWHGLPTRLNGAHREVPGGMLF